MFDPLQLGHDWNVELDAGLLLIDVNVAVTDVLCVDHRRASVAGAAFGRWFALHGPP